MWQDKLASFCDKLLEYFLYILIFFIPISKAGIEITFILLFLVFIVKKVVRPDFSLWKGKPHLFLGLFCGFCALSLVNSGIYLEKSTNALIFKWFEYIILYFMVIEILNKPKKLRNGLVILVLGGALLGIDALWQKFFGLDFIRGHQLIDHNPTASFHNPNDFAGYLVVILFLAIAFIFQYKKQVKLFSLGLFSSLLISIALFLTFSRGAWLGGFIATLFFFLTILKTAKKRIGFLIILFLIIFVSFPFLKNIKLGIDSDRFALCTTAWGMIRDNPFLGKGIGTFMAHFASYSTLPGINYAHNYILQIWAETGVFSIISLFLFIFAIMLKARQQFILTKDKILLGLIAAIIAYLVHGLFDTHFYSLQLSILIWAMFALLVAKSNLES